MIHRQNDTLQNLQDIYSYFENQLKRINFSLHFKLLTQNV